MFVPAIGGELSAALVNAILLALWAALPGLVLAYGRLTLAARRLRPEFALRKSERLELDRAVPLYEAVCRRIGDIETRADEGHRRWRMVPGCKPAVREADADDYEDLQAHAEHLRASISRLKRRPLRRLCTWIHVRSAQRAVSRAIFAHALGLALLIAALRMPGQSAWADEFGSSGGDALVWYPLDERLFYANAVATCFAAVAAAVFYMLQRARLHRAYELEFCAFRQLAGADPAEALAAAETSPALNAGAPADEADWHVVLGLTPAAAAEDIKEAYKLLIKQNHPDRVHDMAPAFRALAEAQTKKINAAYEQALATHAAPAEVANAA